MAVQARSFVADFQAALDKKVSKLSAEMTAHAHWPGVVSKVTDIHTPFDYSVGADMTETPGFEPQLLFSRRNCWRAGPGVLPHQGLPHLLVGGTAVGAWVVAMSWSAALSEGISPRDLAGFLGTQSGATYMDQHMSIVGLTPGSILFVPAGMLTTLLCCGHPEKHDDVSEVAWCVAMPVLKRDHVRGLPDPVKASLLRFNLEYYEQAEPKKLWAPKAEALKALFS